MYIIKSNVSRPKKEILTQLQLQIDEPEKNNIQFSFDMFSQQIVKSILDENIETPFTIGIHGKWGSGKTTLIRQIKKELEKESTEKPKSKKIRIIEFDAWKYEKTDIVSALLQKIQKECEGKSTKKTEFAKAVGSFALDSLLRKSIGISKEDAEQHFAKFTNHIETIRETVTKVIKDKRTIIIVDDLDRCHVENVLDMLEAIKMFLNVENTIFVIAVDMNKIERAWELRYKSETGSIEGREHIEKIFQLTLSLPPKSDEQMKEYLKKLAKSFGNEEIEYFIKSCPGNNPRKIKRMLNLLYFILLNSEIPGRTQEEKNQNFDMYFETLITWISLTMNHPSIAKKIIHFPSSLIVVSTICKEIGYLDKLKSIKKEIKTREFSGKNSMLSHQIRLGLCQNVVLEILENIITKDEKAFMTLMRFAKKKQIDFHLDLYSEKAWKGNTEYCDILDYVNIVIRTAGLVGI